MATEEARSLLDALMGGDRNAPLPPGAAVPTKRKRDTVDSGQLLLPGQRHRSCYDHDIDPLYTAWGVDVYELFVNTKSDIGANPYVVDQAAHKEFLSLPPHEQERLGFHYFLFQKLQELARSCDRIVMRNKEKLKQEINRKLSQRGGQDFVEDVDEAAVEQLARGMIEAEELENQLEKHLGELQDVTKKEEDAKQKLKPLLEAQREKHDDEQGNDGNDDNNEAAKIKQEDGAGDEKDGIIKQEDGDEKAEETTQETTSEGFAIKKEDDSSSELQELQMELGRLTLHKQRVLSEAALSLSRLAPLQESVARQHRNLNYVKSDISTDKTVCEVSGNFMSSRDADERIAAHYAGKQYVGWKLVRDKLQEMQQKFGRYGPPPPGRPAGGEPPGGGFVNGGRGGVYGGRGRGSGGYRGGGGGRWERDGGGYQDRGRRGNDRGGPPPRGQWRR